MPVNEPPPVTPFTSHVTEVFELPETVAENCWVAAVWTVAAVGATDTDTATVGGVGEGLGEDDPPQPTMHRAIVRRDAACQLTLEPLA